MRSSKMKGRWEETKVQDKPQIAAAWSVNIRVMGDPLWQSLGWGDGVEGNIRDQKENCTEATGNRQPASQVKSQESVICEGQREGWYH